MRLPIFRTLRRKRLVSRPFRSDWLAIIERNVPYYRRLPAETQNELRGLVQIFLDEKRFEGCGGIEIIDEIRLTIAAQACILLLGRHTDVYPKLRSILVYPHSYIAPLSRREPDGTITEGMQPRLGESWSHGNIVLSWDDVLHRDGRNGRNVVLHEFAHQLDSESGSDEGAPLLPKPSMYSDWARVLQKEFNALTRSVSQGAPTLLDPYGATSPPEFFAVATECFFERPVEMAAQHPELYNQLRLFYLQDPANR
jgi:Mlc titration factor MtfA (ptsG expression regulator)